MKKLLILITLVAFQSVAKAQTAPLLNCIDSLIAELPDFRISPDKSAPYFQTGVYAFAKSHKSSLDIIDDMVFVCKENMKENAYSFDYNVRGKEFYIIASVMGYLKEGCKVEIGKSYKLKGVTVMEAPLDTFGFMDEHLMFLNAGIYIAKEIEAIPVETAE